MEITTSYYNENDAKRRWKHARKDHTPTEQSLIIAPDESLVAFVNRQITKKCIGTHYPATILVIEIYSAITSSVEFEELQRDIIIPRPNTFVAIYAAGVFPYSSDGPGGYFCWKVDQ